MIKCLVFLNGLILIAKIEELQSELGDPDCKISDVCVINPDETIVPWLKFAENKDFLVRSENILTIVDPKSDVIKSYMEIIG